MDVYIDIEEIRLKNVEYWIKDYLSKKEECVLITDIIMDYLGSERYPDHKSLTLELADYGFLSLDEAKKLISQLWLELKKQQERASHNAKYQKIASSSSTLKVSSKIGTDSSDPYDKKRPTKVFSSDDDWTNPKFSGSKRVHTEK